MKTKKELLAEIERLKAQNTKLVNDINHGHAKIFNLENKVKELKGFEKEYIREHEIVNILLSLVEKTS